MNQSFPKSNRLRKTAEFKPVYEAHLTASDGVLLVFGRPNGLDRSRLGLSVSRKVGNAVVRNRWKRLIRDVFRRKKGEISLPVDLVIIPQRGVELPTAKRVEASFLKIVKRLMRRLDDKDNPIP